MSDLVLRGGLVATADGIIEADVRIAEGVITEVGTGLQNKGSDVLDCSGSWVGPGFVDLHCHLREPGHEWSEDISSGSEAAAAGGYTAVVAMANTAPPIDAGHLARFVADRGRQTGLVDVIPAGCITAGRTGEGIAHYDDLLAAGVRLFTDDGDAVMDMVVMRRAMEYLADRGAVVAQHPEDRSMAAAGYMHEGAVSSRLGMAGIPAQAEEVILARDLALVRLTGAHYHAQHLSTASGVELVAAAKAEGLPVSAEVTPHHLALTDEHVAGTDAAYRVRPPLRSEVDREALRSGLRSGVIDAVATDHAPHAAHDKDVPFEEAPPGMIGLETAAALVNEFADLGPWEFFETMAAGPARIAQLDAHGRPVAVGAPANIVVFDPEARWVPSEFVSRSSNSPFVDTALVGEVRLTVYGGRVTYRDGKVQR